MVFRDMERGLDPEQMASAQDTNPENVRNYIRSLEDLLSGRRPKTRRRRKSKPAHTASCWAETCRQGSAVM